MGALSTTYDDNVLDAILGDGHASNMPATVNIGLSSTQPAKNGTNITEPPGGVGYARVAVANTTANWPAASGGSKSNATTISFAQATGNWGTMAYWVMWDNSATPVFMAYGALQSSVSVTSGVTPDFPAGALTLAAD